MYYVCNIFSKDSALWMSRFAARVVLTKAHCIYGDWPTDNAAHATTQTGRHRLASECGVPTLLSAHSSRSQSETQFPNSVDHVERVSCH